MGEKMSSKSWTEHIEKIVNEVLERFSKVLNIEALIVFGSWTRSGGGDWSDVDILIVSDDVANINILDRFRLVVEYKPSRTDIFIYTYREVENMFRKGNPLILSALIEGIPIKISQRIQELVNQAKKQYVRQGRTYIRKIK